MSNRKRPTQITISGRKFRVTQPDKVDSDDSLGDSHVDRRLIQIKAGQTDADFESCLLHESLHMMLAISGHNQDLSDDKEEALVICLEYGLIELYKRRGSDN